MLTVIIDLDSTAVKSFPVKNNWLSKVRHYVINFEDDSGKKITYYVVLRPGIKRFISKLLKGGYQVGIYSAGKSSYVNAVANVIAETKKLVGIWNYNHCKHDFEKRQIIKPLSCLNLDLSSTIHIDDNYNVFADNPLNGLLVPSFEPLSPYDVFSDRLFENVYKWIIYCTRKKMSVHQITLPYSYLPYKSLKKISSITEDLSNLDTE